ncbi:MAG: hypothetical protein EA422_10610 [Gemmatimonadales bacterium]|nr:MAG: hypothetical protein EA422_10610 [Gemmatimonadales bacterium]
MPFFLIVLIPFLSLAVTGCFAFVEYDADRSFGAGVRGQVSLDRVLPTDRDEDGGGFASRMGVAGGIHFFTPSEGDVLQANADLMVPLIRLGDGAARSYAGTGVSLARTSAGGDSSWDPGLNLLGGVQFERRTFAPFFEARGGLGGAATFSAVVGVRIASP